MTRITGVPTCERCVMGSALCNPAPPEDEMILIERECPVCHKVVMFQLGYYETVSCPACHGTVRLVFPGDEKDGDA